MGKNWRGIRVVRATHRPKHFIAANPSSSTCRWSGVAGLSGGGEVAVVGGRSGSVPLAFVQRECAMGEDGVLYGTPTQEYQVKGK
jgi:hypothetical protein